MKFAVPTNTTKAGVTNVVFLITQQGPNSSSTHDKINPKSAASGISLCYIAQRKGQGSWSNDILWFSLVYNYHIFMHPDNDSI